MVVELLVMGCNLVNGSAHWRSEKDKDLGEEVENPVGRWDCKSKEMIVGIVCHVKVLKPPTFASPLACLSRVYFSRYPQMESLLAGY